MAAANKNVVVLGATGNVGQGIVFKFLAEGATVVAVSRSQDKLAALRKILAGSKLENLHDIVGDFSTEAHATQTRDKVLATLKVIQKLKLLVKK
jgi:short-subunit dehydrogenase